MAILVKDTEFEDLDHYYTQEDNAGIKPGYAPPPYEPGYFPGDKALRKKFAPLAKRFRESVKVCTVFNQFVALSADEVKAEIEQAKQEKRDANFERYSGPGAFRMAIELGMI